MSTSSQSVPAAVLALAVFLSPGAASADVTGHWRSPDGTIQSLVQTGDGVTMTSSIYTYEGTFAGSSIELTSNDAPWPLSYELTLSPDEATLSGTHHTIDCVGSHCFAVQHAATMSRCTCYDGNSVNGDGCDIKCRIEEEGCRSCSGDPATCSTVADGTPCGHPNSCIEGGTCEAGVCEGGIVDVTCRDFSGGWLRTQYSFVSDTSSSAALEAVHENGQIEFYERPSTVVDHTAVFDAEARTIEIDGAAVGAPHCSGRAYWEPGLVAEDGRSFSAWGFSISSGYNPGNCSSSDSFGELAVRCADSGLEAADGCRVDSCRRCGGEPEICESVPDGTPCVPDDAVTVVSTCNGGECVASIADPCPVCSRRVGVNGCDFSPRENCRGPLDATDTKLSLKDADGGDRLKWSWKDGARIATYDLGRTDRFSEVALCIFDGSETPVFAGVVNEDLDPLTSNDRGSDLGWTSKGDGSVRYKERMGSADGITQIRVETGMAGDNSILVKGAGLSLSVPRAELAIPLTVQLQIEGGACFEGRFGADGVSRNADGTFRAKGTP